MARNTLLTDGGPRPSEQQPSPVAWRELALLCAAFVVLLLAVSGRYGYHRDELYFLVIGGHPAFGYVDQPPLIPLLAHWLDAVSGHSLVALRIPSALAGALVVLVTGLIAHEFGGRRGDQLLAAGAMAASPVLLGASHLMSTTSFDLLTWTLLIWLTVRELRDPGPGWLLVGLVAGVALEIKTLPLFLLVALLLGVLIAGPRRALRCRWLWAGALIAAALWAPNLAWQATHDWPQLHLASSIAAGHSGSSQPRWLFIPFQILLFNPVLVPVWLVGLWRLARDPELARWRSLPVAYLLLTVFFLAVGGKPYYLGGMYPALFAAGAAPTLRWVQADRRRVMSLAGAAGLSAVVSTVAALPIVPAGVLHDTPIVAMNYDAGEQIGWPQLAHTLTATYTSLPAAQRRHAIVLAGNYGEDGAVARYAPNGIPVFSGHNSLAALGPPPAGTHAAVAIGYPQSQLRRWFAGVRLATTFHNHDQVDNDEEGQPIWICTGPTMPWPKLWVRMSHLS